MQLQLKHSRKLAVVASLRLYNEADFSSLGSVMVNFMCLAGWAKGCLECW